MKTVKRTKCLTNLSYCVVCTSLFLNSQKIEQIFYKIKISSWRITKVRTPAQFILHLVRHVSQSSHYCPFVMVKWPVKAAVWVLEIGLLWRWFWSIEDNYSWSSHDRRSCYTEDYISWLKFQIQLKQRTFIILIFFLVRIGTKISFL